MNATLHITSGDVSGDGLRKSGIAGEVLVWRDILYEGPRKPGWPDDNTLIARAAFLERTTGGGLGSSEVLRPLQGQYDKLATAVAYERVVLWFDACLFDQSMLAHLLTCLKTLSCQAVELLCVDAFPGIEPFDGLGQLHPDQLASLYDHRKPVTAAQFQFAEEVDRAFASQDMAKFAEIARCPDAPLSWVPAAVSRWLEEQPDVASGLGKLQRLALDAMRSGYETPVEVFAAVARNDTHPQYWGDTTLWAKLNALANCDPAVISIEGPGGKLPQWGGPIDDKAYRLHLV